MPDCECPPTRSPGCVVVVRHAVYGVMHLMSAGLSKLEWWQLLKLLRRYAERDLDQFDAWQFDTASGPVFVQLRRELRADESAEAFRRVDPGGGYSTGRPARVGDLAGVATREDLRRLVGQMHADFVESGVLEWENAALERFLEAMARYLDDLDGYFHNRGESVPDQPDWHLVALLLVAASGYE
jgi:hypothetical protein